METRCFSFPRYCNTQWIASPESVYIQALPSVSSIHGIETAPRQYRNRCIHEFLEQGVQFPFSSIQLDKLGSQENPNRKNRSSNHSASHMRNSVLVWTTSKKSVQQSFLLPQIRNLLTKPRGKNYSILETGSLRLELWNVCRKVWKLKKFHTMLPNLSHIQEEKAQQLITNWPRISGLAGAMKDKLTLTSLSFLNTK